MAPGLVRKIRAHVIKFASEEEQTFCERWLFFYLVGRGAANGLAGILVHTAILVFGHYFIPDTIIRSIIPIHIITLITCILNALLKQRFPRASIVIIELGWLILPLGYFYIAWHGNAVLNDPPLAYTAGMIAFIAVTAHLLLSSAPVRVIGTGSVIYIVVCALALRGMDYYIPWVISLLMTTIAFNILLTSIRFQRLKEAQREFRTRSRFLPGHLVLETASSTAPSGSMIQPKKRLCVCISSDWRDYQKLCGNIPTGQLVLAMNEFHAKCQDLLVDNIVAQNFYFDWIADEMFAVLFAPNVEQEQETVNQALNFALQLLSFRKDFTEKYGFPGAIDIGISRGEAHIGLMGPPGSMKATALGEIPGKARRLQTGGKVLREHLGDKDRVIFGVEGLMGISSPFEVKEFKLPEKLRDLDDQKVFYIEL